MQHRHSNQPRRICRRGEPPGDATTRCDRLAFLADDSPHLSEAYWLEADVSECDASQELSDKVFIGKLLKLMLPRSKGLGRTMLAILMLCDSAWRSISILTKQNSTHRGALPSGVPWTFLANSLKVLKHVALDFPAFVRLVIGGDDSAIALWTRPLGLWPLSKLLRTLSTVGAINIAYFLFHSLLRCSEGSFVDVTKLGVKILNTRYPPATRMALQAVRDHQQSVQDVLETLPTIRERATAIRLAAQAHNVSIHVAEAWLTFTRSFACALAGHVLELTSVRQMRYRRERSPASEKDGSRCSLDPGGQGSRRGTSGTAGYGSGGISSSSASRLASLETDGGVFAAGT